MRPTDDIDAAAVRAHTLGISYGNALSVENSLGTFNERAFESIDYALWAARQYGLHLIIPLAEHYDYYHGGIPTFLRWRNLSASSPSDYGPFYDLSSNVYSDFVQYVTHLLTHKSNITGLTMAQDPVVMAFETGNELGGSSHIADQPTVAWVDAITKLIKQLAPNTLVMSGTYGVRKSELSLASVDLYSNHYYPLYTSKLDQASLAESYNKAFLAGEYDWTNRYYVPLLYLTVFVPAFLALGIAFLPKRWLPWRVPCCCDCCSRCCQTTRPRKPRHALPLTDLAAPTPGYEPPPYVFQGEGNKIDSKTAPSPNDSLAMLHVPALDTTLPPRQPRSTGCHVRRWWHLSLVLLALCPVLAGVIYAVMPKSLDTFLSDLASRTSSNPPSTAGDFYWSLFGRDDQCCQWVTHNDGFTLHYTGSKDSRIKSLVERAYAAQGKTARFPAIACPQNLAAPANASQTLSL